MTLTEADLPDLCFFVIKRNYLLQHVYNLTQYRLL